VAASQNPPRSRREVSGGLAILGLLVMLPMLWMCGYALAYSLGGVGLLTEGWTLKHWRAAMGSGGLVASVLYSISVASVVTLFAAGGALGFGLFFSEFRHSRWVRSILLVPLATPATVLAFLTLQVLSPGGFLSRVSVWASVTGSPADFPVLVNDWLTIGMILAQTCGALPLLALFFLNTWTAARIDRYCQVAVALGATRAQARWRIALPMLLARGKPLILLTFLWNLGAYEIPLLLGRQTPQMFSVLTQRHFGQFELLQRPQAFVLAATYLVLVAFGVRLLLAWRLTRD
jgi:putative spermidine/putrescine transport system permease protein